MKIILLWASLTMAFFINATEIEVSPEESIGSVLERMLLEDPSADNRYEIRFSDENKFYASKSKKPVMRNYFAPLTQPQIDDISFIIRTLGTHKTLELAHFKTALKDAGDRVDIVHPLRFLQVIFSSDELKNYARIIRSNNDLAWEKFLKGVVKTLKEEMKVSNVPPEYIADFANNVHIQVGLIFPAYQAQNWTEFVSILISSVPKSDETDRYNW